MSEWISIKQKLPSEFKIVLVFDSKEGVCRSYRNYDSSFCHDPLGGDLFHVTHWMPLPPPPGDKLEQFYNDH